MEITIKPWISVFLWISFLMSAIDLLAYTGSLINLCFVKKEKNWKIIAV